MPGYNDLINKVEKMRSSFESNEFKTPSPRDTKRWNGLLEKDDASLKRLSNGRQSIQRRARHLATSIFQRLGPEVLLLVVSLQDAHKMAILEVQTFVQALQEWWDTVSHPQQLTTVAKQCFAIHVRDVAIPPAPGVNSTRQDALSVFGMMVFLLRYESNTL